MIFRHWENQTPGQNMRKGSGGNLDPGQKKSAEPFLFLQAHHKNPTAEEKKKKKRKRK